MKLSEIAYSCQINPPRNGFSWKRLLMIITSKIWKGDRSAINSIKKNYTSAEHKELVNLIQSLDKNELKEFQEVLIQRNIEVLKERMGIKLYENYETSVSVKDNKVKIEKVKGTIIYGKINNFNWEFDCEFDEDFDEDFDENSTEICFTNNDENNEFTYIHTVTENDEFQHCSEDDEKDYDYYDEIEKNWNKIINEINKQPLFKKWEKKGLKLIKN